MNKGFSLIEIILVLVISAVVIGLAVPSFSKAYEGYYTQKISEDLLLKARYAKHMAVASSRIFALVFSADQRSYILRRGIISAGIKAQEFEAVPGPLGRTTVLQQQVQFKSSAPVIYFQPDASMTAADIEIISPGKHINLSSRYLQGALLVVDD